MTGILSWITFYKAMRHRHAAEFDNLQPHSSEKNVAQLTTAGTVRRYSAESDEKQNAQLPKNAANIAEKSVKAGDTVLHLVQLNNIVPTHCENADCLHLDTCDMKKTKGFLCKTERSRSKEEAGDVSVGIRGRKRNISNDGEIPVNKRRNSDSRSKKLTKTNVRKTVTGSEKKDSAKRHRVCELDRNQAVSSSGQIIRQVFEEKYQQLKLLGEGGHAFVYAGFRRTDHVPVAIKHIPKDNVICKDITVNNKRIPVEVAVMTKLSNRVAEVVGKSPLISLLDFYRLDQELILVLERPDPSVDLLKYIGIKGGSLSEEEAKELFKQLVEAALELENENIFHRDIKIENILIEMDADVPRLRLIDFGLSCFTKKNSLYKIFYGTSANIPPEWYKCWTYRPGPTTVWQLGLVLFEMLHRNKRFETKQFMRNKLKICDGLSNDCKDLLYLCLAMDPHQRPTLNQLKLHPWIT